jgi:O-antigen ligase
MINRLHSNRTLFFICLTVILSPLYIIRWTYGNLLPTTLLELLIWLTIIVWITERRPGFVSQSVRPSPLSLGIILLGIAMILSVIFAPDLRAAFGIARAYLIEPFLIYFIIQDLLKGPDSQKNERLIFYSVVVAGTWLSVLGISQYIFQWLVFTPDQFDRAHGVFNNGNALALFLGPLITISIAQLVKGEIKRQNYILFFVTGVMLMGFLATKSLGGLLAVIAATLVIVLNNFIKSDRGRTFLQRGMFYLFLGLVILFFAFLSQVSGLAPKVDNPWVRPGGTAMVRLCIWEGTYNLIRNNPILGTGLAGFQKLYSEEYTTCDAEPLVYPHNIFLNFWTELGLIGLIGFLIVLGTILRAPFNVYMPFFVYFVVHGLVDVPYFKNDLALMFWIFLALWQYRNANSV